MKLGDHMCVIPFGGGSSRDRSKTPMLQESADDDFLNRGLPPSVPSGDESRSKVEAKRKSMKRKASFSESQPDSDRITLSRLVAILREAFITTMKSFASKPGGLGGIAMGGNIDLPDATPSRTFKEPRDFVRSWSKRRPDYISTSPPGFTQRARPSIAVQ